jgi:hypothetical protein
MKVFDNYEISPCKRYEEPDSPGKFYFEVCAAAEADVWTLYGHINGEGVQAIGDFSTREHAKEVYSCITGQAFPDSYLSADWLRVIHTGPKLLEALKELVVHLDEDCPASSRCRHLTEAIESAHAIVAEATRRAA